MPKHSDISEDEEEWLEEELSRGKGKKKSRASESEDGSEGASDLDLNEGFSDSDSGSDVGGRGRANGGGRKTTGGAKAAPPPLKKRKNASSPSGSSDEARDELDNSEDDYGDDLMGDDHDRIYLSSLTEMEREKILNERYEARKKRQDRMELRRKLQQSKGTRASSRTSTAKGTGGRKVGVKASALSNLKAKREEKATRAKRHAKELLLEDRLDVEAASSDDSDHWSSSSSTRKRAKLDSRSSSSSSAAGGWDVDKSRENEREEGKDKVEVRQYPTLEEINSVKLDRSLLEKWLDQPFFEKVVPRFFVRVGIGMNREQQNAYRMAQIVVAEKGARTYTVGKKKTQYVLKLSHGSNSKNFSIEFISNSPITMPEYERWLRETDKADLEIPTPEHIHAKKQEILNTRNYIYTHEDIERMIQEKSQLRARPVNLGATKAYLLQLREAAKDKGTPEEVEKAEAELARFVELDKRETEKRQKLLKVGDINKRNKAKNIVSSHVTAQIEAVMAETDNPFSRRPTAPTFHIFAKNAPAPPPPPPVSSSSSSSSTSSSSSSSSSSSVPPEAKTPVPQEKTAVPVTSPAVLAHGKEKQKQKEGQDAEAEPAVLLRVHDTLDLDIEVNLDDLTSPTKRVAVHGTQRRSTGGGEQATAKAKAISLDDYKRRRGLI